MSTKNETEIFEIVVDGDILGPLSGQFKSFESANDAAIEASRSTNDIVLNVLYDDSVQDTYVWRDGDWEND